MKKAQEYKQLYNEAKQELVKERVKSSQLAIQIDKMGPHAKEIKLQETTEELQEVTRCFEKSELIRKQQKILIGKMKDQIEQLQQANDEQSR